MRFSPSETNSVVAGALEAEIGSHAPGAGALASPSARSSAPLVRFSPADRPIQGSTLCDAEIKRATRVPQKRAGARTVAGAETTV